MRAKSKEKLKNEVCHTIFNLIEMYWMIVCD